ncbi:alkaline phosphatase D family protein [Aquimarina gracilis]|uniref:Alkaline phosphatase D family protein n=1 Tax=Aquimarina gracilis TaxID=874422 RepID=A0ABU5ZYV7_9FLAO|nr:alkaline phosphatase D family protein [Aquimarina gracilis]MEB3347046.1 alkaline phosphatase D family protein [Aquimarina gracilis]
MQKYIATLILLTSFCFGYSQEVEQKTKPDFVIAFGSCNKQNEPQPLWKEILKHDPNLFVWGGDNIYADSKGDTGNIKEGYAKQNTNAYYQKIKQSMPIMATWDDHDYGKNDAGVEWKLKEESQKLFLDFFEVPTDSPRRYREGIYTSEIFEIEKGSIKVIVLDTRYFRSPLRRNEVEGGKRYLPYENQEGTLLGESQWKWLESELANNFSDFLIIVSSIQFLSSEHGFECWGNFPHEVDRLKRILVDKAVRNVIILSGDRHISEFSLTKIKGLKYPLIDFTSSGLTHAYTGYKGESNRFRVGNVVSIPSFGLLKFNFDDYTVSMQMRGKNNLKLQEYTKQYPKD